MSGYANPGPTIEQKFTLQRIPPEPGTIRVRVEYDLPDTLKAFDVQFYADPEQVTATGFDQAGSAKFSWDKSTPEPEMSFLITQSRTRTRLTGFNVIDTRDWTILEGTATNVWYRYSGAEPTVHTTVETGGEGIVSDDESLAFLGAHEELRERGGDQEFRLVIPEEANIVEPPEAVLGSLIWASKQLQIEHRDETLLTVASPSIPEEWLVGGRQTGETGFWVNADSELDTPGSSWYHEYIHTRQGFEYESDMKWLVEGMAEYYAGVFGWLHDHITFVELHDYLETDGDQAAILSNPSRWTSRRTPYTKGRRVVAALDARIREQTDRSRTFMDVARELNRSDDAITYASFVETISDVTGLSIGGWLDQFVNSSATPDVPSSPELFTHPVDDEWPRCRDCSIPLPEGIDHCGSCSDIDDRELEGTPDEDTEATDEQEMEPDGTSDKSDTEPTSGGDQTESETTTESETEEPESKKRCPICESLVVVSERYCPSCGHDFGEESVTKSTDDDDSSTDELVECPICGEPESGQYCDTCGAELESECPICGFDHEPGEEYCPGCGHEIGQA